MKRLEEHVTVFSEYSTKTKCNKKPLRGTPCSIYRHILSELILHINFSRMELNYFGLNKQKEKKTQRLFTR